MRKSISILFLLISSGFCVFGPRPAGADGQAASDSVGPGFEVGGDVVLGPANEYQVQSSVAFDGTNYLVVWADYRSRSSYDVFGARVALDGTVLDPGGFIISAAEDYQDSPAVAFDGTNYLVVWTDRRSGSSDIYGSRVSPGGTVLDPDGIPVCTGTGSQAEVGIAFCDSNYLVVWTDTRDLNENIYGGRVAPDGTVLDGAGTPICTDTATQRYPAASSNGAGWLVVWQDRRAGQPDIYGARVTPGGMALDAGGIPMATDTADETYPAVTYNGIDCMVVWGVDAGTNYYDVYGTRVDTSGTVLDPGGITICDHVEYQGYPAASSYGSTYFVVWDDYRNGATWDIYGARIDSAGAVIDTTSLAICLEPSQLFGLALALGDSTWLISWHDSRNDHKDIFGIRVSTDGLVLDASSFLIGISSVDQARPAVAFDGANHLVVWHEWREGSLYDIRGARVTPDGTVLDPAGIPICTLPSDALYPALAFDGTNYLVAWEDYRNGEADIYATRVSTGGTVLDTAGIAVSIIVERQERPTVTFNGFRFLVAWQDGRRGDFDIRGSRVSTDGVVHEPFGILISDASTDQKRPAASSDGYYFFVVWEDARNVYNDIFGTRIGPGGAPIDSGGIPISTASLAQERPDVVFDGDRYAVVWQDKRASVNYDIRLARVTTDGTVLDPSGNLVSNAAGDQEEPAITFNGREYVMVWQDGRTSGGSDIYGAHVDTSGAVTDPDGFEVSVAQHNQVTPDLCSTPVGVVLMTYSSYISDPGYGSYRIWGNLFDVVSGVPGGGPVAGTAYLYPGFPNPFRERTTLRFVLAERAEVAVRVYDVGGRLVATLVDGTRDAGIHDVTLEPGSGRIRAMAPGVYFVDFKAGSCRQSRKILLLR
ncbi:MAG: T9SS type A sorting domain-containing protein [bacterium]